MEFTKLELDTLIRSRPDLDLKKIPVPSLDGAIVEFLEKYEVFVKPVTSRSNKIGDAAIAGAIGGAFGADVAGDAFIASGQNK
ncbi:hypothetical protein [Prochlorococcus sp. MIT 1011]|uniref:hypothetical protein n=1 Tax=Prochlorococcus sp. MIT 1011 TaxID=3082520 RepID=UPI0039B64B4C